MTFWEAMKAMHEGKKVRCKSWSPHVWISTEGDEEGTIDPCLYWTRCVKKEWELYEEPQKIYTAVEMVAMIRAGKKMRRRQWEKGKGIAQGIGYLIEIRSLLCDDWVEDI